MAKNKNESNNKNSGTLLTEKDGTQYFVMGKVRIKESEHFAQDGKPVSYTHLLAPLKRLSPVYPPQREIRSVVFPFHRVL